MVAFAVLAFLAPFAFVVEAFLVEMEGAFLFLGEAAVFFFVDDLETVAALVFFCVGFFALALVEAEVVLALGLALALDLVEVEVVVEAFLALLTAFTTLNDCFTCFRAPLSTPLAVEEGQGTER